MRRTALFTSCTLLAAVTTLHLARGAMPGDGEWRLVGWNDLGMHCMDSDYEVFAILPPFNTVCAQLVDPSGEQVHGTGGITIRYYGVADPSGSINTSSIGKTNFWSHVQALFGVALAPDQGLAGNDMPGPGNVPQPMHYDGAQGWYAAEGVPLTPMNDAHKSDSYPLMRLEARGAGGQLLATTDVVLPVSDEMDCRTCHASGGSQAAEPGGGWVGDPDYERDYRLNVLRLHDSMEASNPLYANALATLGMNVGGLYPTVVQDGRAVLCASCHESNALPGTGLPRISPLTQAVHAGHADVLDPISGVSLDDSLNRSSCYRCHPGSETRCLRGAMGSAVATDGSLSMQCQNCHGSMSEVGSAAREGWFDEPNCQNCHSGTATHNNGQIRYADVFEPDGTLRVAVDATFATNPDSPLPGTSLYRSSEGHGGLACSACHGSTHAVFPSAHANDNIQNLDLQGHAGTLSDCTVCHDEQPETDDGGPHGMHPIGAFWVDHHTDAAEHGAAACRACHGLDYRGTVLSRAQGDRTLSTDFGTKHFWEGFQIGCYDCHNGPNNEHGNSNHPPTAFDGSATTPAGVSVDIPLAATDQDLDAFTLRIVKQPHGGTVSLTGSQATYFPFAGFAGDDEFSFAARDGDTDSNLAQVAVRVTSNWLNYGEGHAGTLGVPELSANTVPVQGGAVPIHMGNSLGSATTGFVIAGYRPDYQPTLLGGALLVRDAGWRTVPLPIGGLTRPWRVPTSASWIGRSLYIQLLVIDPGATEGYAFSRGLQLTVGP